MKKSEKSWWKVGGKLVEVGGSTVHIDVTKEMFL